MARFRIENNPNGTTTILAIAPNVPDGQPIAIVPSVLEGVDIRDPATLANDDSITAWLRAARDYVAKHQPR